MGQGEWGYISIEEMLASKVELDLYFKPVKFGAIERKMRKGGQMEIFAKDEKNNPARASDYPVKSRK